jgi:membrane peptidoglycan carboxypeptidase
MAETPPTTPDVTGEENPGNGGWRKPTTPGTWRVPEKREAEPAGWRVPTLPSDLEEEPVSEGIWHLPRPQDTVFSPEDEIEIRRPEDEIMALARGESALAPADEEPVAPEDLMYLLEHLDEAEDEDDFETMGMSELVALASLAGEEMGADVVRGEDSEVPIDVGLAPADDEGDTELIPGMLSPAERALLRPGTDESAEIDAISRIGDLDETTADPAEYARRQLEQLGLEGGDGDLAAEAIHDPAEYARQQLEQLGLDDSDLQEAAPAVVEEPPDPRQIELGRQFRATQEQVRVLRERYQRGEISQEEFMAQLQNLMILDDEHTWWMMGVESDTWYRAENNAWIPATPGPLLALERYETGQSQSESGFSLPYLDEGRQQESEYTPSTEIPLDENYMPLPKQVPLEDSDYTVPSAGVFGDRAGDETVPGQAYYDQTAVAQPVQYGTIEAPVDDAEPPDYDLLEPEGEIYQEAVEEQRQTVLRIVALVAVVGLVITFLAGAAFVAGALLWYQDIVDSWESGIVGIAQYQPEFQTVTILDNRGEQIATLSRGGDDRRPVDLEEISPYMIHAVISLENRTFYEDPGWDLMSILRAFGQNLVAGDVESGASTITQQVARNLILQTTEVTAERKVNEIIVAGELTRRYSKNQILELYLNEVAFFGNQTYGVEAAAQFYFNKPAAELTLPEAAMLAAIVQSPANNEPVNNLQTALDLMRQTMNRMAQVGCLNFQHQPPFGERRFCVDQARVDSDQTVLDIARVEVRRYRPRQFAVSHPHFIGLVQAQLENLFGATEVYQGGYVVTTTLDSRLQDEAQEALIDRVNALNASGVNTGALMVTDPRNGAILALVGSPDFNNPDIGGQVDGGRTYQQPGSAIKPIVYAAALMGYDRHNTGSLDVEDYYTPASIIWDVPTNFPGAPGGWPRNFDGQHRGPVSARAALQQSLNVPAVKTYQFVGTEYFRAIAEAMGLRFASEAEFTLATGIGATEVRLYDMMMAFGTIANNGQRQRLFTIENITDRNGNPVALPAREEPVQALRPGVAHLLQNILSDDQARAPQFGLNSALTISGLPTQSVVGAKTGTTDGNRDLWTMGFTNNRVVGVWLGTFDDAPTSSNNTGFTATAPLWNTVMRAALRDNPPRQFTAPGGVVSPQQICADTGTRPGEICANVRTELFASNQPPPGPEYGVVTRVRIDSWSGLEANDFCPDNVIDRTFARIGDAAAVNWINNTAPGRSWAQRVGLQTPVEQAPQQACSQGTPIPVARIASPSGGQTLQGSVPITGQVSAENFNRYQVEYAPAGTEDFRVIGDFSTTQQPNAGSTLATWDTTGVTNGDYTLRLMVFSSGGGFVHRTVNVTVNNPPPTPTPTPQPSPTSPPPPPPIPTDPLPFDPIDGHRDAPPMEFDTDLGGPTPTIDPVGG